MRKKAKAKVPETPVAQPHVSKQLVYMRIAEAWRAILGLPKDFHFGGLHVMVCMATAEAIMEREKTEE